MYIPIVELVIVYRHTDIHTLARAHTQHTHTRTCTYIHTHTHLYVYMIPRPPLSLSHPSSVQVPASDSGAGVHQDKGGDKEGHSQGPG